MSDRPAPFKPGDRFLDFEIRGLLGRGGHAHVFEAYDTFSDRNVAIKIIPKESESGRDLAGRAQSEARVLVRVKHPNVVDVYHAGKTENGDVYLIMEKLEGRSLRQILKDAGKLSIAEAVSVAIQVCDGVQAAHSNQVIHRDLKPDNIFVGTNNHVKVFDFGIAKVEGYAAHKTTQRRVLHGTMLYMSPEQLQGFPVNAQSDIFALGTLLYESLYGHPALLNPAIRTIQDAALSQITTLPPMLHELDPDIPKHLARFVHRAILKNPDERYASMAEMAQAAREVERRLIAERGQEFITDTTRNLLLAGTQPLESAPRRDSQSPTVAEPRRAPGSGQTEVIPVPPRESQPPSRTPEEPTQNLNRIAFEPTQASQVRTSPLPPKPGQAVPPGVDVNATVPGIGVAAEPRAGFGSTRPLSNPPGAAVHAIAPSPVRSPSTAPEPMVPAGQDMAGPARSPSNPPLARDQRSRPMQSPLPRPARPRLESRPRVGSNTTNVPVSSSFQNRPAGVPAPLMSGTNWKARGALGMGIGLVLGVGYGVFSWTGAAPRTAELGETLPVASPSLEPSPASTGPSAAYPERNPSAGRQPTVTPRPESPAPAAPRARRKAQGNAETELSSPKEPRTGLVPKAEQKSTSVGKEPSKYNERLEWLERDLKQESKKQNTEKEEKPGGMPTEDEIWAKEK